MHLNRILCWTALAALPLLSVQAHGNGVELLGEDFQVNTTTDFRQDQASVSMSNAGDFVVVWVSEYSGGNDDDLESIQGQRYAADGTPAGGEFQVNTYTSGRQSYSDVAVGAEGDFVVVWRTNSIDQPDLLRGQLYDSDGAPLGGELELTSEPSGYPSVAVQPDGFVVVWRDSGDFDRLLGQRFDSSGARLGDEFQANTYTSGSLRFPEVASDEAGDFVVVWQEYRNGGYDIRGRRFASSGTPIGGDFRVNEDPMGRPSEPAVATAAGAGFVVVWEHSMGGIEIRGRRFDSSGASVGGDILVHPLNVPILIRSRVALDDNGNALFVWDEVFSELSGSLHDASGKRLGEVFQINTLTTDDQDNADVAIAPNGEVIAVWGSDVSSGPDTFRSIQGRRLVLPLFADGFESGDTSAWDVTVQP